MVSVSRSSPASPALGHAPADPFVSPFLLRWYRETLAAYRRADALYETQRSATTYDQLQSARDHLNEAIVVLRQAAGIPCHAPASQSLKNTERSFPQ